jgi:hypothetical protein
LTPLVFPYFFLVVARDIQPSSRPLSKDSRDDKYKSIEILSSDTRSNFNVYMFVVVDMVPGKHKTHEIYIVHVLATSFDLNVPDGMCVS